MGVKSKTFLENLFCQNLFIPSVFKFCMADSQVNMPSGFGGLQRYNEEYESIFMLKPVHVIVFVVLIVAFRVLLGVIF